jgi:hypothetical protein
MGKEILIAGGTGDLGGRIIKSLISDGANVKVLARPDSKPAVIDILKAAGSEIKVADWNDETALADACKGTDCVISALAGLRDVIIDAQRQLLNAAVNAEVPRFIPSDFCTDYTKLGVGENRNFDLRREFSDLLHQEKIKPTSIFNGAFAELLNYNIPFLDHKNKTIAYWEKLDWKVDFTSMNDTAAYTAKAAIDDSSPRYLRIASFQISAKELSELTGYQLKNMGSLEALDRFNKSERLAHPEGEHELYAKWQQSMYMHSMFSAHNTILDNDRFHDLKWSTLQEYLR